MRFRLSILGVLGGASLGGGVVIGLQQFSVAYPTPLLLGGSVAAGALVGLVVPSIARRPASEDVSHEVAAATDPPGDEDVAPAVPIIGRLSASAAAIPVHRPPIDPPADAGPVAEESRPEVAEPPRFKPSHVVPAAGLAAWSAPDPDLEPVARLEARVELEVLERAGAWARVGGSNGWTGWVDGRLLVPVAQPD